MAAMKKLRERSDFVIYSYFKDSAFTTDKRNAKFTWKEFHLSIEGIIML